MQLKNAGIREQEFARQLVDEGRVPVDFETFLNHGVYDASRDEVSITVKAVALKFKVERA